MVRELSLRLAQSMRRFASSVAHRITTKSATVIRHKRSSSDMATVDVQWRKAGATVPLIPRFDHSITAVGSAAKPKVFAIGGHGGVEDGAEVQVLDASLAEWSPFSTSWEPGSGPATLRRGSHAAAAVGSSIFVIGGFGEEKTLGDVMELNTEDGTWSVPTLTGEAPGPRSSHSATAMGTRIYVIGGHGEESSLNDVHILDTATRAWITPRVLGDPPPARCSHSAEALGSERIVVFGGYGQAPLRDLWFLEVDTPYVREQREALGSAEVVAWSRGTTGPLPTPVVICGPSGVGKGTLIGKLMQEFPAKVGFSVSHTTRKAREGEVDGVHYHFTTREWMEPEVREGRFLESADVHGNMYGTSMAAVERVGASGKMCILDIDVQGAQQVKRSPMKAVFVFVAPPSFEELEKRLRGRGTETEAQIEKRLRNAKAELERGKDTSLFDHTLVNDDLDACYGKLKKLLGVEEERGPAEGGEGQGEEGPSARSGHATAVLGSRLVVHGGTADKGIVVGDVHVLETRGMAGGAPGATTGVEWATAQENTSTMWTGFWSVLGYDTTALSPMARYNHKAVALSDREMLVAGGYDGANEKPLGDSAVLTIGS